MIDGSFRASEWNLLESTVAGFASAPTRIKLLLRLLDLGPGLFAALYRRCLRPLRRWGSVAPQREVINHMAVIAHVDDPSRGRRQTREILPRRPFPAALHPDRGEMMLERDGVGNQALVEKNRLRWRQTCAHAPARRNARRGSPRRTRRHHYCRIAPSSACSASALSKQNARQACLDTHRETIGKQFNHGHQIRTQLHSYQDTCYHGTVYRSLPRSGRVDSQKRFFAG